VLEEEWVCAMVQLSRNGRKVDRQKLQTSASVLGLAAGAIGWSGLANAASEETNARIMLLPDHYELTDGNVVVFKLETGEELTLSPDQYLIMQDGLLLITDELAQASIQSLPVMGSVRSEFLRDLSEMSTPTESEVTLATPEQARSILDGDAPRLFEEVSIERFELAQAVPSEEDEGNSGALTAGGATIIGGLIAAGIFGGDNPPEEPEPEPEPSSSGSYQPVFVDGVTNPIAVSSYPKHWIGQQALDNIAISIYVQDFDEYDNPTFSVVSASAEQQHNYPNDDPTDNLKPYFGFSDITQLSSTIVSATVYIDSGKMATEGIWGLPFGTILDADTWTATIQVTDSDGRFATMDLEYTWPWCC